MPRGLFPASEASGLSARQGETRNHLQCLARKKLGARIGGGFGTSNEGTQCTYALGVVPALAPLYSKGAFEGIDYFFGGGFGLLLIRFRVMRLGRPGKSPAFASCGSA